MEQRITAIESALNQTDRQDIATAVKSPFVDGHRKESLAPFIDSSGDQSFQRNDTGVTVAKDGHATIDELTAKVAVLEFMSETDKQVILELSAHIAQLMDEKDSAERASEDLLARLQASEDANSAIKKTKER